ncbi:hypothetical protein ACEWY4_023890 [Coilia grayii]|uniref:Anterior gradient protein 2 homolog n=1 Tax=Coilia grayii TaxID=363190 RepID=A0ABD1IZ26_9TELE
MRERNKDGEEADPAGAQVYKSWAGAGGLAQLPPGGLDLHKGHFGTVRLEEMAKALLSVLLVLVAASCSLAKPEKTAVKKEKEKEKRVPQTLSRGWGDQLIWAQTYEEALFWSRSRNKPLMVIFHLEDCPHSLALRKVFAEDKAIQKLADEEFILLNLVYDTVDKNLTPDGQYVPRILFVDPSMTVRADITGRYANRMYAYEPSDAKLLLSNMQKAMKFLKTEL